jgi:hypothetical protein
MRRALIAVILFAITGCIGTGLSPDDKYLKGLDPEVVEEALANPEVQERLEPSDGAGQQTLAQGMVINFIVCRDVARVYLGWRETGKLPPLAPLPVPDNPTTGYAQWKAQYKQLRTWHDEGTDGPCVSG